MNIQSQKLTIILKTCCKEISDNLKLKLGNSSALDVLVFILSVEDLVLLKGFRVKINSENKIQTSSVYKFDMRSSRTVFVSVGSDFVPVDPYLDRI